jgi:hypothetical protein
VKYHFKLNSFSVQFYALRDIKAGEQFFYAYCSTDSTLAQRQAELAPYGLVCKCPACANATPETDKLRTTFKSQITLLSKKVLENSSEINKATLEDVMRLEYIYMVKEGLDVDFQFTGLVGVIALVYRKLGKMKEGDKYYDLLRAFQKSFEDCDDA